MIIEIERGETMNEQDERCLRCGRTSEEVPLIRLRYKQSDYWICPQDLPILIHRPEQLTPLAGAWQQHGAEEPHGAG